MSDLEYDECRYRAAELRDLLKNWSATSADVVRATIADAAETLEKAAEAVETWPEWAAKLLNIIEDPEFRYEADDEITLPEDFAEWWQGYKSAVREAAKWAARAAP